MGLGLIGTALAGAAEGLGRSAAPLAQYAVSSQLKAESDKAQAMRDERFNELANQRDINADQRKRAPIIAATKAADGIIASRLRIW